MHKGRHSYLYLVQSTVFHVISEVLYRFKHIVYLFLISPPVSFKTSTIFCKQKVYVMFNFKMDTILQQNMDRSRSRFLRRKKHIFFQWTPILKKQWHSHLKNCLSFFHKKFRARFDFSFFLYEKKNCSSHILLFIRIPYSILQNIFLKKSF